MSDKEVEYKEQIVAFIDIMGFSNLIKQANENKSEAVEIIKNLKDSISSCVERNLSSKLSPKDESLKIDPKFKIFSDCISISSDCIENSEDYIADWVFFFLLNIMYIQAELIVNNIFIRGGVTVDLHYQSDDIIFSSGLVNSYKLESKEAIYPRVLIDSSVINLLRKKEWEDNFPILNNLIKRDADGLAFLDYLEYIKEVDGKEAQLSYLAKHKERIEQNLNNTDKAKIKGKYLWVARYHNQKISEIYPDDIQENLTVSKSMMTYDNKIFKPTWYLFTFKSEIKKEEGCICIKAHTKWAADKKLQAYIRETEKEYNIEKRYARFFEKEHESNEIEEMISECVNDEKKIIIID
ncbi:hypothetical protein [Fuchsiella alkaliacetigena]|uniref:hypothetical protein n=1 Tax=Fuchsiella alkaliacetigena TaxID=957042 RepID=UPI002009F703|nr:hypothetical protein [Fuchsiella alkaliacetigena]MCK8824685.1 hypothetical protein [Fuchsiella alkaliacetigena]